MVLKNKRIETITIWDELEKKNERKKFHQYRDDPIRFCKEVLHEDITDDIQKMLLSVRDNRITYAQSATGTGKTHGAAALAVWWYKCFGNETEEVQVQTYAPSEAKLKLLLWGELWKIVRRCPELFKNDKLIKLQISRTEQSGIFGVTIPTTGSKEVRESKVSGIHPPHLLIIFDEGDTIPPEVWRGAEGCMSGGHVRLIALFNPRAKTGHLHHKVKNKEGHVIKISAFTHPNVITGKQIIPGAVDREQTVRRINKWSVACSENEQIDNECFRVPDFLVGTTASDDKGMLYPPLPAGHRRIIESALYYMVLGEFPAQAVNQLISYEWYARARSRWDLYVAKYGINPPAGIRPTMGLDIAEFGPDKNAEAFRYGGWIAPINTWGGVDPLVTAEKGAKHYHEKNAEKANVDATGVGASVAPTMVRLGCDAIGIKSASKPTECVEEGEFGIIRDQMLWRYREWLRTDTSAMMPSDEHLEEESLAVLYEKDKNSGKIKMTSSDVLKENLNRSPDKLVSVYLTHAPSIIPIDAGPEEEQSKTVLSSQPGRLFQKKYDLEEEIDDELDDTPTRITKRRWV